MKARYKSTLFSKRGSENDRGYRVYRYVCLESDGTVRKGDQFTASGYYLPPSPVPVYDLCGEWKERKDEKIYTVLSYSEEIPETEEAIVEHLSSGIIKGMTKEYAELIYGKLGKDTIKILDQNPDRMLDTGNIPIGELFQIRDAYDKERCQLPLLSWLNACHVRESIGRRVYEKEGRRNALSRVKEDPYMLFRYGVPLNVCEKIASSLPLPESYCGHIKALGLNILKLNESSGNVMMQEDDFLVAFSRELEKCPEFKSERNRIVLEMEAEKLIAHTSTRYVYLADTFHIENEVAKKVALLAKTKPLAEVDFDLEKEILAAEKRHGIRLHENQRKAIATGITSSVTVITGGPGTGKTTVVKILREIFEKRMGKKMLFMAPTGRAAARMKESSGYDAYTIHKTLLINDENLLDDAVPTVEEDAVVCDEASMLDIFVAAKLFGAITPGHQIILLGDVNQLPSVGAGKVLNDLIESGVVNVAALTKVYRQSSLSRIFLNCQKIVKGNLTIEEGSDFEIMEAHDFEESADLMVDTYLDAVKKYGMDEVCCLCPFRQKTASGSIALNKRIQEKVNPSKKGLNELKYGDTVFREGDRVMNRRNITDACNGDIGKIIRINPAERHVVVEYPQSTVNYYGDDLDYLTLSYAMSIHKSQGSEFKCCITNLLPEHGVMLQMNLINTAISRAKDKFILIGCREAIETAIKTRDGEKRLTNLIPKLQYCKSK